MEKENERRIWKESCKMDYTMKEGLKILKHNVNDSVVERDEKKM